MILIFILFNKTVLCAAIEKENIDVIKLLLTNDKIDVNIPYIIIIFCLNKVNI